MEHQNKSMAVTIPHPGVIKFVAIHIEIYEGFAYWWDGRMVELYETCLIWMVDMATTSLHTLCMTIHQAKNFFMSNNCVGSGRSKQSWRGPYCTSWMRFSKVIIFTTIYPPKTSFFIFQRTSQKCTSEYGLGPGNQGDGTNEVIVYIP
jgi:hypothetical protein